MIKIDWTKFIRGYMWFGMYWAKNSNGYRDNRHNQPDMTEIPGWVTSNQWWDWFIPMQKR